MYIISSIESLTNTHKTYVNITFDFIIQIYTSSHFCIYMNVSIYKSIYFQLTLIIIKFTSSIYTKSILTSLNQTYTTKYK